VLRTFTLAFSEAEKLLLSDHKKRKPNFLLKILSNKG